MTAISILHAPTDAHFAAQIAGAFDAAEISVDLATVGPSPEIYPAEISIVIWSPTSEHDAKLANAAVAAREKGALVPIAIAGARGPETLSSLPAVDLSGWAGDQNDPRWRFVLEDVEMAARKTAISDQSIWTSADGQDASAAEAAKPESADLLEGNSSPIASEADNAAMAVSNTAASASNPETATEQAAAPVAMRASTDGDLFSDKAENSFDLYREFSRPPAPRLSLIERLRDFRMKPSSLPFAVAGFTGFAVLLGIAIINFAPGPVPPERIAQADIPSTAVRSAETPEAVSALRDEPVREARTARLAMVKPSSVLTDEDFDRARRNAAMQTESEIKTQKQVNTQSPPPKASQSTADNSGVQTERRTVFNISADTPAPGSASTVQSSGDPVAAVIAASEDAVPQVSVGTDALAGLIEVSVDEAATGDALPIATPVTADDIVVEGEALTEDGELAEGDIEALDVTDYFATIDDLAVREFSNAFERAPAGIYFRDCLDCPDMAELGDAPIAMAIRETTFKQWNACVADGACNRYRPSDEGWGQGARPVVNVSYRDAQGYVAWLSRKTGHHYRLPSAHEWRDVAEAGALTDNADKIAPTVDGYIQEENLDPSTNTLARTLPAGAFRPNGYGLFDMNSNVSEWTSACVDGADGAGCQTAVVLGASWRVSAEKSEPVIVPTGQRRADTGFRVVRDALPAR